MCTGHCCVSGLFKLTEQSPYGFGKRPLYDDKSLKSSYLKDIILRNSSPVIDMRRRNPADWISLSVINFIVKFSLLVAMVVGTFRAEHSGW